MSLPSVLTDGQRTGPFLRSPSGQVAKKVKRVTDRSFRQTSLVFHNFEVRLRLCNPVGMASLASDFPNHEGPPPVLLAKQVPFPPAPPSVWTGRNCRGPGTVTWRR